MACLTDSENIEETDWDTSYRELRDPLDGWRLEPPHVAPSREECQDALRGVRPGDIVTVASATNRYIASVTAVTERDGVTSFAFSVPGTDVTGFARVTQPDAPDSLVVDVSRERNKRRMHICDVSVEDKRDGSFTAFECSCGWETWFVAEDLADGVREPYTCSECGGE